MGQQEFVQLHDGQRINTVSLQRCREIDSAGFKVRHPGDQHPEANQHCLSQALVIERRTRGRLKSRKARQATEAWRESRSQQFLFAIHHQHMPGDAVAHVRECPIEGIDARFCGHWTQASALHLFKLFGAHLHAALEPQRPCHRKSGAASFCAADQLRAMRGIAILERIRIRIVSLPRVSQYAADRGEGDKEVQWKAGRGAVHDDGSFHLRRENFLPLLLSLANDEGVADETCGMDHPVESSESTEDLLNQLFNRCRIAYVGLPILDGTAEAEPTSVEALDRV